MGTGDPVSINKTKQNKNTELFLKDLCGPKEKPSAAGREGRLRPGRPSLPRATGGLGAPGSGPTWGRRFTGGVWV